MKKFNLIFMAMVVSGLGVSIQAGNDCMEKAQEKYNVEQRRCSSLGNSRVIRNCRRRASSSYIRDKKNCQSEAVALPQVSPIKKCRADSKNRHDSRLANCEKYSGRRAINCRRRESIKYNNELNLWCSKIKIPKNDCETRALNNFNRHQGTCNNYQRGQDSCRRGATTRYNRELRSCSR